ncbi:hypothetical protein [Brevundimonas sp.]|uniref:hypothetical protein n=1 Tax=Brevundimonas sp. TaxID=1871086 RepID=UPI002ABAB39E|nr:hypothetical protein [Brevundimonas sp.]MDZ4362127.1 hypothetical protein [Brevundimonas sp.]
MSILPLILTAAIHALGQDPSPAPDGLNGTWSVDLSADPAQPYLKSMTLTLAEDGTVSGEFYDSAIQAGRWKAQNGRLCVAFRTTDGAGPYHTAACLAGDRVEGQTWAEHRNFVFVWNAERPGLSATPRP